ncbi:MAG: shikimate kinase [Candidatus Omnitrophota bacterium]
MNRSIALTGFMGAGKTATAEVLCARLGCRCFSTDDEIIRREGRPITEIFRERGEAYFRQMERDIVREITAGEPCVIDCGGGLVMDEQNRSVLRECALVIYLKTSPDQVFQRVKDSTHRPLLNVADPYAEICRLIELRSPVYEQADIIVNTDGKSPDAVADEILKSIPF